MEIRRAGHPPHAWHGAMASYQIIPIPLREGAQCEAGRARIAVQSRSRALGAAADYADAVLLTGVHKHISAHGHASTTTLHSSLYVVELVLVYVHRYERDPPCVRDSGRG